MYKRHFISWFSFLYNWKMIGNILLVVGLIACVVNGESVISNQELTEHIMRIMPDVCMLNENVRTVANRFSAQEQVLVSDFMDGLESTMKNKLVFASQNFVTPTMAAAVDNEKLKRIVDMFGLSYKNNMCSKDVRFRLQNMVSGFSNRERMGVYQIFNNLKNGMRLQMPMIFSQVFSQHTEKLARLDAREFNVMKAIGPHLYSFFNTATGGK